MERVICPLCHSSISDWQSMSGKTIRIEEKECHKSCLQHLTIRDIEAKTREAS